MMRMPFIPGDFRTPPFPGMEGFLPPALGQFQPHLPAGFPPGLFPLGMADIRGRGGFRGARGFPIGFPPRGFPPPMIGFRGRGRGRGGHNSGGHRNKDFNKKEQGTPENPDNPMLSAIYGNNPEDGEDKKEEITNDENDEHKEAGDDKEVEESS